jgi:gliding motility-associated-like protein
MNKFLRTSEALTLLLLIFTGGPSVAQVADFSMSPSSGCAPLVVSFINTSSGGATSYSWNLGNSSGSTLKDPSTTYTAPGKYPVTLTVTGVAGASTKIDTVTVFDKPAVSFAAAGPLAGCAPHSVQFNSTVTPNSPGTATYSWNFGDGNGGTGANAAHTYVTPGTYTVTLTVTNGAGCTATFVQNAYITAWQVPAPVFSASATAFCNTPAAVTLANNSTGGVGPYTTNWTFGDGGSGTGSTVGHTYTTGGGFTVTMIVTDSRGCRDTLIKPNYIGVNGVVPTFSAPASLCQDRDTLFVVNTTTGNQAAHWDFGDGDTVFGSGASHIYSAAGNYIVTMTVVVAGCTKLASKSVTVNPTPAATITQIPSVPCPAPVTVNFTANSTHAISYAWSWTNGGTATGQTVSKNYTVNPFGYEHDKLRLITTSAVGCTDTIQFDTIFIRDIMTGVEPAGGNCLKGIAKNCFPFTIPFSAYLQSHLAPPPPIDCPWLTYPAPIVGWKWDFGDGSPISTAANPIHTYTSYGDFKVQLIITTANGCVDTGGTQVHTDTPVHPSFIASPLSACQNSPVTLYNTTDTPLTGTTYKWEIADAVMHFHDTDVYRPDTGSAVVFIKSPGLFTVRMYSNHGGCQDSVVRDSYIRINPPGASFIDSPYCSPFRTTVKFINTSTGPTSQYWDFGDGDTSTAFSPVHTYPADGLYHVRLIVHNNIYGCYDTLDKAIQVNTPSFSFTYTDTAICTDESVGFQAFFYGYGHHAFSYVIEGIQYGYDTIGSVAHKFINRGYHDVTLLGVYDTVCVDTITKARLVLVARPELHYKPYPPAGCMPLNVQFRDSSTNVPGIPTISRKWVFESGDTVINNLAVVNRLYPNKGKYYTHLTVTDSLGCESDLVLGFDSVFVSKPVASFIASDTGLCLYEPVTFTDTSAAGSSLQHRWDFGDGSSGTGSPVSHSYAARGTFSVRLIVTDSLGCIDTLVQPNLIGVDAPYAGFTMSDSLAICPPLLVTFNNSSAGAATYRWDFGTGSSPVVVTNPVNSFNNPGLYSVVLVASNANGCTDTVRDTIRVLGYNGAFTYSPLAGCVPMPVQFSTALTGIPQITWDFGDGSTLTSSSTTASHTYSATGKYFPRIVFSDGAACSSSSTGLDTISVDQVEADFNWSVPCMGVPFTLTQQSTALYNEPVSWSWYFSGGSDTAAGSTASYSFATGGNHAVTLVAANATGCTDTLTRDVFINYLPPVQAPADTNICPGDTAMLFARGARSYVWSPASQLSCVACDTTLARLIADTPGAYSVFTLSGTDSNGCVNTDSVRVAIQLKTTSSPGQGGEICVGESFRLHAEGAQRYEWLPAATIDSPFIASPLARPERTTTYIVAAREGSCLVDSQRVVVVVHSLPLFSAGNDETIAAGSAVTLKPTQSGITRIEWRADSTLSCVDCFRPNAHPYYTTTYYATGYNEYGCEVTDSVTVFVRCNGSLVFIPNTFTPNGDGRNDYFFPRGKGLERMSIFRVFNRWGEMVFERTNVNINDERAGWDGTFKGKELAPDVYVYVMQSECSTGEILQWKGDVALVR